MDCELYSGRPSRRQNRNVIEQVRTVVFQHRHITDRKIANDKKSIYQIGTLDFDREFTYGEIVHDICTEAANNGAGKRRLNTAFDSSILVKHNIPVRRHAPYSPNMAPCAFGYFWG